MAIGLILGKHISKGLPGKNYMELLGRPMVEYALMAQTNAKFVDDVFVSTDSKIIKEISTDYDVNIIDRPQHLATDDALGEDVIVHALNQIQKNYRDDVEIISISFANAPQISVEMMDYGIQQLQNNQRLDSAFSVSKFNSFSPVRARKITEDGLVRPYEESIINESGHNSNRDSLDNTYFFDWSIQVLRKRLVDDMQFLERSKITQSNPPWRQFGERTLAIENQFSFDIDYHWQIPVAEYWLRENGFTEDETPYE